MLKKKRSVIMLFLLILLTALALAAGCGDSADNPEKTEDEKGETAAEPEEKEEEPVQTEPDTENTEEELIADDSVSYYAGSKADWLGFGEGKDVFGEKSISIIGDSISQGKNSVRMYYDSFAARFKRALGEKYGAYNMGYVSFNDYDEWNGFLNYEIHRIYDKTENWTDRHGEASPDTPGNYSYTASASGAALEIRLDREADGIDHHINGFYIYHTAGPGYGEYQISVNGQVITSVDCDAAETQVCARSPYIEIPEGLGYEITIEIVKLSADDQVTITGISYIDQPDTLTVNNYSLSGIRLIDIDDEVLREISRANVVLFTLGTNDAGTEADINEFQRKLNVVVEACRENGSVLVVGDVIWDRYGDASWATPYKDALQKAAEAANGYFIDFTTIGNDKILDEANDISHPTYEGHRYIAEKLCRFFELEVE